MTDEEANMAMSKSITITTLSFLINIPRAELEEKLKNNEYIDEFEIEELDDKDIRKDVFIIFKNPVDIRYLPNVISEILGYR